MSTSILSIPARLLCVFFILSIFCACSDDSVNLVDDIVPDVDAEDPAEPGEQDGDESIETDGDQEALPEEAEDETQPPDGDKPDSDPDAIEESERTEDEDGDEDLTDGDPDESVEQDETPEGDDSEEDIPDGDMIEEEIDWGEYDCNFEEPSYFCMADVPETCPDGICLLGMCIGGHHYAGRWDDCGDGLCHPCEDASICPADCGDPFNITGEKEYVNDTTITVWVHGFANKSPDTLAGMTYGADRACSDILEEMGTVFGIDRPCGDRPETEILPNQFCKIEYYGAIPADWMSEEDIAEVEQYPIDQGETLQLRFATILAKYIRHKLDISGATHVNMSCHSMGCLITRTMIENNMENLAAEGRFVRWFTSTGVIAGAQLARLSDNPTVQGLAETIGLPLNDFVSMNPDNVQQYSAVWDRKLREGNNPYFAGMIIHQAGATDSHIEQAIGIQLLDLDNSRKEPNDGIMFTEDEYFHDMADEASLITPSGKLDKSTHTYRYADHMNMPDTDTALLLATATLFHSRKVYVRLKEIELFSDRESHGLLDGENGEAPAEVVVESTARYNPYIQDTFGVNILAHESMLDHRSTPLWIMDEGQTLQPGDVLYAAPVFDEMQDFQLSLHFLEVDWDEHLKIEEWIFDVHQGLLNVNEQIPLVDHQIERENEYLRVVLEVEVVQLY